MSKYISDLTIKRMTLKLAKTLPLATVNAMAERHHQRALYFLKVLQAPAADQAAWRTAFAASPDKTKRQLAAIFTGFSTLSAASKAKYITAFKRRAKVMAAVKGVAFRRAYSWGQVPVRRLP